MNYQRFGQKVVMKLAIGEGIKESLISLAEKENIRAAEVTGIGAVDRVDLAFYHLKLKIMRIIRLKKSLKCCL